MGKAETKYANTANRMDAALLTLLSSANFEDITVTDVCKEAHVHRSTFYAHYANTTELLDEVKRSVMEDFFASFGHLSGNSDFLSREYLLTYLGFLEDNRGLFRVIMTNTSLFDPDSIFLDFREPYEKGLFGEGSKRTKYTEYRLRFIAGGITCLVASWLENSCMESKEKMAQIIISCVKKEQE